MCTQPDSEPTRETLTNSEVHCIVAALCHQECSEEYDFMLADKLYRMFPEVKAENEAKKQRSKEEHERDTQLRKEVTGSVVDDLDWTLPVLEQLKTWIAVRENWTKLKAAGSDDICLAGDLWRYHFQEIRESGLIRELVTKRSIRCSLLAFELRKVLKEKSLLRGNKWMKDRRYITTTDEEMWHELSNELGLVVRRVYFGQDC